MKKNVILKAMSILVSLTMIFSPMSALAQENVSLDETETGIETEAAEEEIVEEVSGAEEVVEGAADAVVEETEDETVGAAFANVGGGHETIFAEISGIKASAVTAVSWSGTTSGSLTSNDIKYLVRDDDGRVRIDIPGVPAGTYTLKVTAGTEYTQADITVAAYDRSGFAHYGDKKANGGGVGAYDNEGKLKKNAIVIYVTDANKNTVQLTYKGKTVTGIGSILNTVGQGCADDPTKCKKVDGTKVYYAKANDNQGILKDLATDNIPLDIRFVGMISDSGLYEKGAFAAKPYGKIEGLTAYGVAAAGNFCDYGGTSGDNGHMARMKSAKNVTIEGIGTDAGLDGWGVHFMCESSAKDLGKSFEVRNLTFINTPEDAIGMEGVQSTAKTSAEITASVERCWIHNNEFYCPNITDPAESDKSEGDGSVDFKRGQYFTCSYNYFEDCHKTNLVGSADTSLQYNLTYHHNYWFRCKARGPLTRNANVHMYNNVFFGQTDYAMNTRANAYIFSESNLFYACKSPQAVESGAIKSFNDSFSSYLSAKGTLGTVVSNKTDKVANACKYEFGKVDYSSFDTNASLSYCADENNYDLQDDLDDMRKVVAAKSGVLKEDGVVDPDSISLSDSRISVFSKLGFKPVNVSVPSSATVGKISKTAYAFTADKAFTITFGVDAASKDAAVLVDEAGVAYGTANVGSEITVKDLPAGSYAIQPMSFQPGDAKKGTLPVFKETVLSKFELAVGNASADRKALTGITLSKKSFAMVSGAKIKLNAALVPSRATTNGNNVQWKSSNAAVAVVDNGTITAKANGDAVITASITDGKNTFEASCNITVSEPKPLTGLALSTTDITLMEGKAADIDCAIFPADTTDEYEITFESEDVKVATVGTEGLVTAVKEGTTNIIVSLKSKTADTSGTAPIFTAKCAVTVEKAPVVVLPAGSYEHNFSTQGTTSTWLTFPGSKKNTANKTGTYNGMSFTKGLKFESSTQVAFTAPCDGKLMLVCYDATNVKIGDEKYTPNSDKIIEVEISAGDVLIQRGDSQSIVFYMAFVPSTTADEGKNITGVAINKTSLSMTTGSSETLVATIEPADTSFSKSINWKSSNPEIATVKNGVVTAYKAGKAEITAESVGNPEISAVCIVTVTGEEAERPADENKKDVYTPVVDADDETADDEGIEEPGDEEGDEPGDEAGKDDDSSSDDDGKDNNSSSNPDVKDDNSSTKNDSSSAKDDNSSSKNDSSSSDNRKSSSSSSEAAYVSPETNNPETVKPEKETIVIKGDDGKEQVIIDIEDNRTYNGKKQIFTDEELVITVIGDNGEKTALTYGKDFKVSYKNNKNANMKKDENGKWVNAYGDADDAKDEDKSLKNPYAIIKYKGAYKSMGIQNVFFDIYPVNMANVSLTEKKSVITAKNMKKVKFLKSATVTLFGKTKKLNINKDILEYKMVCTKCEEDPKAVGQSYDLNDSINAPAGMYSIYASGQGNFYGSTMESEFELVRK